MDTYKLSFWLKDGSKVGFNGVQAYSSFDAERFAREILNKNDEILGYGEFPTRIETEKK